jgi:cell division protein FtsW
MAITTGVFPVSGQPLPFISKGGTSVLVMSAAIGIMLSVSKYAATNKNKEDIKIESKELPKDMQAINPTQFTYNDIKK